MLPKGGNLKEDFELCSRVCGNITKRQGVKAMAQDFSEQERVVALVWTVTGIIENGGFHYLFESCLPGDPYFKHTLMAFEKIGCNQAVNIFKRALSIFPNCEPPIDDSLRIGQYENLSEKIRNGTDTDFWQEMDSITRLLAAYIRVNFGDITVS